MLNFLRSYKNKISNKLFNIVYLKPATKIKGHVLLSYMTEPFTFSPFEKFPNYHTNYWECFEIARIFLERGYAVDVINSNNSSFKPKKSYDICVDIHQNLERLAEKLPKNCKKVMHIVGAYGEFQNNAEQNRLDKLELRRGVKLVPRRKVHLSQNPQYADFLEGFGNDVVLDSYKKFNKPIFHIPISTVKLFNLPTNKNWIEARKNFLWFSGGGMVHKGLDLTIEAFVNNPTLNLHIFGPLLAEQDFVNAYKKELYSSPNIKIHGRVDPTSKEFEEITNKCASTIHLSSSEGTSGAVVQSIHAGLIPIITPETGIMSEVGGIILKDPSVESVERTIKEFSELSPTVLESMAHKSWKFVQDHYTREQFTLAYERFVDTILKI